MEHADDDDETTSTTGLLKGRSSESRAIPKGPPSDDGVLEGDGLLGTGVEIKGHSDSPRGSSTAAAHDENGEIRRDGWASESVADEDEEPLTGSTLSGEQDAAIAGIVTTLLIVCANVYWGAVSRRAS